MNRQEAKDAKKREKREIFTFVIHFFSYPKNADLMNRQEAKNAKRRGKREIFSVVRESRFFWEIGIIGVGV
jgi:methyltransferase-like protein